MEHPVVIDSRGRTSAVRYNLSAFAKSHLVSQYISSPQGRSALAAAMAAPLRRTLNYHGIARQVLSVTPMPQGALPIYERDIDVAAVIRQEEKKPEYPHNKILISSRGRTYVRGTFPSIRRVHFPLFEIAQNPTVSIAEVKRRRFNLIDRQANTAKWQILAQEDEKVFAALDAAGNNTPLVTVDSNAPPTEGNMDQNTINKVSLGIKIFGVVMAVVAVVGLAYSLLH